MILFALLRCPSVLFFNTRPHAYYEGEGSVSHLLGPGKPPHLRDLFMDRPEAGMSGWEAPPVMGS